jgi:hypothetical protein
MRYLAALAALASLALVWAVAVSSGPTADPVVDGWPVGDAFTCSNPECEALLPVAQAQLDTRDPGHAPVVHATLHHEGVYADASGHLILSVRSGGCCQVARFELADGTIRAIGVGYPGISQEPMAFDYGP